MDDKTIPSILDDSCLNYQEHMFSREIAKLNGWGRHLLDSQKDLPGNN